MRRRIAAPALLILLWMPPAWAGLQQDDHKPDQGESSSKPDSGTPDDKQGDETPGNAPDNAPSDQKPKSGDDKDSGQWSSSSSNSTAAIKERQELPKYNPLPAEQDVDVGMYYMHKGDADAAIGRFQDAIQLKADYAKPRLLLAQLYEKKHDTANAVKYYKEYLQVYPHAPDAKKVQAKIEKMTTR